MEHNIYLFGTVDVCSHVWNNVYDWNVRNVFPHGTMCVHVSKHKVDLRSKALMPLGDSYIQVRVRMTSEALQHSLISRQTSSSYSGNFSHGTGQQWIMAIIKCSSYNIVIFTVNLNIYWSIKRLKKYSAGRPLN